MKRFLRCCQRCHLTAANSESNRANSQHARCCFSRSHQERRRRSPNEPGEWRVREELKHAVPDLEIRPDRHFLCSREEFAAHATGRKQLRLEFFYWKMRRKHKVLMNGDQPVGGTWNFDKDNRGSFGMDGPEFMAKPVGLKPDATTLEVLKLAERRFAKPHALEPEGPRDAGAASGCYSRGAGVCNWNET